MAYTFIHIYWTKKIQQTHTYRQHINLYVTVICDCVSWLFAPFTFVEHFICIAYSFFALICACLLVFRSESVYMMHNQMKIAVNVKRRGMRSRQTFFPFHSFWFLWFFCFVFFFCSCCSALSDSYKSLWHMFFPKYFPFVCMKSNTFIWSAWELSKLEIQIKNRKNIFIFFKFKHLVSIKIHWERTLEEFNFFVVAFEIIVLKLNHCFTKIIRNKKGQKQREKYEKKIVEFRKFHYLWLFLVLTTTLEVIETSDTYFRRFFDFSCIGSPFLIEEAFFSWS